MINKMANAKIANAEINHAKKENIVKLRDLIRNHLTKAKENL